MKHAKSGEVLSVRYPGGVAVGPFGYDKAGRLTGIQGLLSGIDYGASGEATRVAYANGIVSQFSYDAKRGWLDKVAHVDGASPVLVSAAYGRDEAGRIISLALKGSAIKDETLDFTLDKLDRLTSAGGLKPESFAYDPAGNITSQAGVGAYAYADPKHKHAVTKAGSASYVYDANGNLVSGIIGDPAGGVRTLTYDGLNRPVTVASTNGVTSRVTYGPDGSRVKVEVSDLSASW